MSGFFQDVGSFLVQFLFGFYIFLVIVRFVLQWVRADFYNPLTQGIVKITNPPLLPLRRIIPGLWGVDLAAVVLALLLQGVAVTLLFLINNKPLHPIAIGFISLGLLLQTIVYVFLFSLLVRVISSWINPHGMAGNPVFSIIASITEPIMRPARRLIPPMGGFDLSVILVFAALYIILILIQHLFGV